MPHKPQLDGLRFLAFLAVFYFHAYPGMGYPGPEGVQVFFTLSGFLITRILILGETGRIGHDLGRFYFRRTLRIFPLYYAVVLGLWLHGLLPGLGWYLTYTYNVRAYLLPGWGGPVGHFWTLSVEEQFYLLFPPALLLTPPRLRFAMVAALLVGSKAFQAYARTHLTLPWSGFLLPYCGEHLLWGCLAGLIELRAKPGKWEGPLCLLAGVPLMVLGRSRPGWWTTPPDPSIVLGTLSCFGLGSALVVFGLWRTSRPWIIAPLTFGPVAYLGRISYGLYVFHLLVLERGWFSYYVPEYYLFYRMPYSELGLTIAISALSWHLFERPINRLKDRAGREAAARAIGRIWRAARRRYRG